MFLSTFFATLVGLIFQPLLNFFTKLAEKRSNVKSFSAELLFNIKMLEDREKALNEAKEAISCLTIDKNKKYGYSNYTCKIRT